MELDVFQYTNQGGRLYNEDSVGYDVRNENGIFVVADGLGGHSLGELASQCVCNTLTKDWNGDFGANAEEWLKNAIAKANQRVLELQEENNTVLKSTVVVLAIEQGKAVWANVGDSRLYYYHDMELCSCTNDHSVAYKKYKAGEITRNQIRTDEDQSCLLRAVGGKDHNEPEIYDKGVTLEAGDAFMLCSDGVWEYLQDGEILIDLHKAHNAREWAELLLLRIMQRIDGKNDNLTILTIMV